MYESESLITTRFPQKLWKIISECKSGAIHWSLNGASILFDYKMFHEEYLTPSRSIFKTSYMTSFIRQLNLYGFRKITSHNRDRLYNLRNPDIHEFSNVNFHRDRVDLLCKVTRKNSNKKQRYQRINVKNLSGNELINKYASTQGMSRLQLCQMALREALDEAVEEYRQKQLYGIIYYKATSED